MRTEAHGLASGVGKILNRQAAMRQRDAGICPDAVAVRTAVMQSLQGFNVRRWRDNGLNLWAVSDINADELMEFGDKFEAALKQ